MIPGNRDIILHIPVKTHAISNQRRFGLPCPLLYIVNYSIVWGVWWEVVDGVGE